MTYIWPTVHIQKSIDCSVNHKILFSVLEKHSFGINFIKRIEVLLKYVQ